MNFPDELVQQFRQVALGRLDRIESAWGNILVHVNDEAVTELHREIHTLKGESRVLGFNDVNVVCHKLEDLLEVARSKGYAVDEDFDLTVNMALRFMAMLVRKKVGSQLGGIDLPGFVKQIDQLLSELRVELPARRSGAMMAIKVPEATAVRVPAALRQRLGPIAIDAFIEYAGAKGTRRNRLRQSWHSLRDLAGVQRAIVGEGQVAKHKSGAVALARDLGKTVDVVFEMDTTEVTTEVLAVLDVAVLHLLRNAIDHGVVERGRVRIAGSMQGDRFVLVVEDDGRGIQFDRVRTRAVEMGLVAEAAARALDEARLVDIMCQPGFSTRSVVDDISGRGVGLDVVRARVTELEGSLTAQSRPGQGTTWTIAIPVPAMTVRAHVLRAPGVPFPVALDAQWTITDEPARLVDVSAILGLTPASPTFGIPGAVMGQPVQFTNGQTSIAFLCERDPAPGLARRLLVTPPTTIGEVVLLDSVESLLVRPERLL